MNAGLSPEQAKIGAGATTAVLFSIGLYLAWTLATYLLEGRINLYRHPTIAGRYVFVLIANLAIGTIGAAWILRSLVASRFLTSLQSGFQPVGRTILTIVIAVVVGCIYLFVMRLNTLPLLVIINGFAQVLSVSIAEIVVCWALVGASFESLTRSWGKFPSVLIGIIAATIFFSVYHIGHSAPFNQVSMMLLLLFPGILTSLFYFISRNIYGTILFHNFQGIIGVLGNLKSTEFLNRPLFPLYFLLLLSIVALVGADVLFVRRAGKRD